MEGYSLDKVVGFLDNTYGKRKWKSGLKIPGRKSIRKALLMYDIDLLFTRDMCLGLPDLIISHHPIKKEHRNYLRSTKASICVYHDSMDSQPLIGNNMVLIKFISGKYPVANITPFGKRNGGHLGYSCILAEPADTQKLHDYIIQLLSSRFPVMFYNNIPRTRRLAVISGGDSRQFIPECLDKDIDTFITGELDYLSAVKEDEETVSNIPIRKFTLGYLHELALQKYRLNIIAPGHEETELPGLFALQALLSQEFRNLKTEVMTSPDMKVRYRIS